MRQLFFVLALRVLFTTFITTIMALGGGSLMNSYSEIKNMCQNPGCLLATSQHGEKVWPQDIFPGADRLVKRWASAK
ncbi:MAG: hypothetical protein CMM45_11445 [Rhodospirillaceae bacterium]|nr:hypothetical protein [Rhodospirillaceae bacterium]